MLALTLALHIHLQRHLPRLHHSALLIRPAHPTRNIPFRSLLVKEFRRLRHGEADELGLGSRRWCSGRRGRRGEEFEGLQRSGVAYPAGSCGFRVGGG
jgi:hypothetical protein